MSRHQKLALEYWSDPDAYEWRHRANGSVNTGWWPWRSDSRPKFVESSDYEIRRIQRTITMPECEVPEPVWEPEDGQKYYLVESAYPSPSWVNFNGETSMHRRWARDGLLYPSTPEGKEQAIARAKACALEKLE